MSLNDELAAAAAKALGAVKGELGDAVERLLHSSSEAKDLGREYLKKVGEYIHLATKGEIDPDIAQEAIARELDALSSLAAGLKEAAAQEAIERTKRVLKIATDVGIALAKAAIAATL